MEIGEYANIYQNEDQHFFYTTTHNLILKLIKTTFPLPKWERKLKILDAGCGTGLLAKKLEQFGEVVGIDTSSEAVKFSKKRGVKVIKGSVNDLPFKNNLFDLITCIDVIYHRGVDDQKAIKELFRVLKPGGILILRVAAINYLKSSHDSFVHTRHRYSKKELSRKLKNVGFEVKKISYVNFSLLLPALIHSLFYRLNPPQNHQSGVSKIPQLINKTLTSLLSFENILIKFVDLPLGIGLMAVSKKP